MKKYQQIAGFTFFLIGLAVVLYSLHGLGLGTTKLPGPGFFPFLCGLSIIVFSGSWLLSTRKEKDVNTEPFWGPGEWVRPLLAVVLTAAYGAIMDGLGYVLSTFLFIAAWQFLIERENWKKIITLSVVGTVAMYVMFQYMLSVPLPEGILSI